ncbi:MAG TPA: UDP-N-acetylmuramoyl-L-alanine--D-glutamate ligase [Acidimicrobiales bacterium]|nr:UDP-N-acetylmuramoyl-L-alanine--D-glutamate ligase [Acidimicrobiales bacterium]
MRPAISWADLGGRRVGVWGARVEGAANLRRLAALGITPAVVVDDAVPGPVEGRPVVPVAGGGLEALAGCDVVVKSPGVSRHGPEVAALEAAGVAVTGGLALWLQDAPGDRVVCVTGSKGKSTTAAVAGHLAAGLGRRPFVGGNIGRPPWDPAAPQPAGGPDLWIIETSSFQAADVARSPRVVVVTSLSPDHLDWHGDVETYYRDKLSLCSRPGAAVTVANGDDPVVRAHRDQLGPDVHWVGLDHPPSSGQAWVDTLGLLGDHNRRNALLAGAALAATGVDGAGDPRRLAAAGHGFEPLASRLRPVASVDGVLFVDDSLSTNVLPTVAALDVFAGRRVALLAGGHDRGIDYGPLAAHLLGRADPTLLLALPDNGARIAEAVERATRSGPPVRDAGTLEVRMAGELAAAVRDGWAWARPDGVVLLSPAAASFGRYRDYRARSEAFAAAVEAVRTAR